MEKRILCAGFGGQGVLALGQMLTYAGMVEDKEVSWLPSYGPEMRGGAANCAVVISEDPVGAPNIDVATDVIVMNQPSFDKFKDIVEEGGNLFINTSLIDTNGYKNDKVNIYEVPVSSAATSLGNVKMANMVMLGSFLEVTDLLKLDSIIEAFQKVFGDKKAHLIPANKEAINAGRELIKNPQTAEKAENKDTGEYRKTPKAFALDQDINIEVDFDYDDEIFKSPVDTARFALSFVENTISYYNDLCGNLSDRYGCIFKSLAEQKEEHAVYLRSLVEELEGSGKLDNNFDAYQTETIFTEEMSPEEDDEVTITALKSAIYLESNGLEFYEKASERVENAESKELYKELAKWQGKHFEQIDEHTKARQDEWWSDQSFSKM